jgi:hypothetical protein
MIGLILLSMVMLASTAVAIDIPAGVADSVARHQIVQRLVDYFADPACAAPAADPQQEVFDALRPMPGCWLITEAQTAPNQIQNKGVQNEK